MSKPGIFILSLSGFIIGVFLGAVFIFDLNPEFFASAICAGIISSLILFLRSTSKIRAICFACMCGLLGFIRAEYAHHPNQYRIFQKQKKVFYVQVISDPGLLPPKNSAKNSKISFKVRPDGFDQNLEIFASAKKRIEYGDYVYMSGKVVLPKNFSGFDYVNYLAAKNIYAQMYFPQIFVLNEKRNSIISNILNLKHYIFYTLQKMLPQDRAGLLIAILTGNKNFMFSSDLNDFNKIGLAHMIAVSGYKLTIILIWIESLILPYGRRKAIFASAVFSFIYLVLADFAPAVWRAVFMSAIFIYSKITGKKFNLAIALLTTAVILIFINPLISAYDIGFQLSFLGILGIILFAKPLRRIFEKVPAFNFADSNFLNIGEVFISGTSAQIATFPLMLYYFHQFSPLGPLLNILVVPFMPIIIFTGYFCILPAVGKVISIPLSLLLYYILLIARAFARI